MDNLEKFISENRKAFDDEVPSLKVWAAIDRLAHQKEARQLRLLKNLRLAAAIAVLLITGAAAGNFISQVNQRNSTMAILQETAPEFFEMEEYLQNQINHRVNQLASYNPDAQVLQDLDQIDQAMSELKKELRLAPKGQEQEIVENLIQNYQTKIAILERVLEKIQSTQPTINIKKDQDEISM